MRGAATLCARKALTSLPMRAAGAGLVQAWEEGDGPFPRCDDDQLLAWPRSVEDEVW